MYRRYLAAFLILFVHPALHAQDTSRIKSDETILFFPAIITPTADNTAWEFRVHGWIYEPSSEAGLALTQLRNALGLEDDDAKDPAARSIFRERASYFLVDNERDKRIRVRVGEKTIDCDASQPNGHFFGKCRLTAVEYGQLCKTSDNPPSPAVECSAVLSAGDSRRFAAPVCILTETGVSVVSDIDDTIKISQVRDKKALLKNTFLRRFRPAPGMAELYADWAKTPDTSFHYVSASPWQLYPALEDFRRSAGFPPGTYHLKLFRWKDESFLNLFKATREHKIGEIEWLMRTSPKRRFVLVGDSGEMDPEIYGEVARKNPGRVVLIVIRDVTGETAEDSRYAAAFKKLPKDLWTVVKHPSEAPRQVP